MMMTKTSGMMTMTNDFMDLYNRQVLFQTALVNRGVYADHGVTSLEVHMTGLPADYPGLESYHIQQLISEIGEVLEADKRWKSFRNSKYDLAGKKDEIADCFIVLMNVAIFSGFTAEEILEAIESKITVNNKRMESL